MSKLLRYFRENLRITNFDYLYLVDYRVFFLFQSVNISYTFNNNYWMHPTVKIKSLVNSLHHRVIKRRGEA